MARPNIGHKLVDFFSIKTLPDSACNGLKTLCFLLLLLFCQVSPANSLSATGTARSYNFDIPQQPLAEALIALGKEADLTIVMPSQYARKLVAPTIQGEMTLIEALNLLLSETDLGYKFIDRSTLSISPDHPRPKPPQVAKSEPSSPPPNEPPFKGIKPIEEVIVTSQRRSQNLQQVPKAISVVNDEQLRRAQISDLEGLGPKVPGLTVAYFSLGQPTIHMRGIGSNDDGAGLDNSVVVYLDDIYVGRISAIDISLLDVERLEVLRGPQGTLYGRNTIGGAINVVSKKPTSEPSIDISATLGNYDYSRASAIISGPLKQQQLLGKLALSASHINGWQENLFLDEDQHGRENISARSKLLYLPNESVTFEFDADYTWDNMNSTGRIPVVGRVPIRILDENGALIPITDGSGNPILDKSDNPVFETRLPTEIFASLGGDVEHAANGLSGFTDRSIWGITARAVWQNRWGEFSFISGYRNSDFAWAEDSLGLPPTATDQRIATLVDETHSQLSKELRWASAEDKRLSYMMGLYFLREKTKREERFPFETGTAVTFQENVTNSYALFGQADYDLTDQHTLTFGARYTYDSKRLDQSALSGGAPAIILEDFRLTENSTWDDFSPSIALSYQANEDLLLYGSASRGFKSGGFQGAPGNMVLARRSIDPERAWNYELGVKSEWLHNRLRLNLVTFYTDFSDLQVVQFRTVNNFGVFETSNAASATLRGVETEFILHPMEGWKISGSYAYLRATYDSFNDLSGGDFNGNRLRQAPKHSFDITVNYEWAVWNGTAQVNLDYRYQDKSFREPDNSITVQPAYDLLDAQFSYRAGDGSWEATLWSKNLLDEEYIAHLYILGGNDYALFGTPRTYGVTLSWRYR